MTGNDIKELRSQLGLTAAQLAELLGVHGTTVFRWEKFEDRQPKVDPAHLRVLLHLQREQAKRAEAGEDDLGDVIIKALLIGGGLYALYMLLNAAFKEGGPK